MCPAHKDLGASIAKFLILSFLTRSHTERELIDANIQQANSLPRDIAVVITIPIPLLGTFAVPAYNAATTPAQATKAPSAGIGP